MNWMAEREREVVHHGTDLADKQCEHVIENSSGWILILSLGHVSGRPI